MGDEPIRRPRRKRRSFQQMMEDSSGAHLRAALPRAWVVHGYAPDYGIDGTIEIFRYVGDDDTMAETLGEMFLFQLKSTKRCRSQTLQLHPRPNVEKGPYRRLDGRPISVEVFPLRIDTDELLTIEAMGSGLAVVVLLVCMQSGRVFFLNLTDYIDKVLTPERPDWRDRQAKIVHVPALNEVTPETPLIALLRFYGIRPKLMGAFAKIHFQWAELGYGRVEVTPEEWHAMASHFANALLRLDIWELEAWELLPRYRSTIESVSAYLKRTPADQVDQAQLLDIWFRLDAIGRTWEDVTREWGLPTQLGHTSSYPPSWLDSDWPAVPAAERR